MDKFLSHIDLPQSSFNAASTTTYFVPERAFTVTNQPTALRAVTTKLSTSGPAITFVTSTTNQSQAAITLPSGIQAGDIIYIVASCGGLDAGVPSGYTSLFVETFAFGNVSRIYYKIASGNESGTSVTYATASGQDTTAAGCAIYRGVSSVSFIGFTSANNLTTVTSSGFTGALGDLALVSVVGLSDRGGTTSSGAGPTKRFEAPTPGLVGQSTFAGHYDEAMSQSTIAGGTEINIGGNPSAGFTRVRAKFDGTLQNRNSGGVDSIVGGAVSVASALLTANFNSVATPGQQPIPGLTVTIPPGKSARVFARVNVTGTAAGAVATAVGAGINIVNPAGANAAVSVAWSAKIIPAATGAAAAGALYDGDVQQVAANVTYNAGGTVSIAPSANVSLPVIVTASIVNLSTNTSCTVQGTLQPFNNTTTANAAALGSAIFAIIT